MEEGDTKIVLDDETLLIHADDDIEPCPDLAPPIHVSTTFRYVNANNPDGYTYSRFDQPTRKRLEKVLGALEGGHAIVYSSGSAAGFALLMYYRPPRIFINKGYKGTHDSIKAFFAPWDEEWQKRVLPLKEGIEPTEGDLLWLETPKNPTCDLEDITYYSELAHKVGAFVIVDSTFATPILQKPLALGADIVLHSCSKFLSGLSDVLAGALIAKQKTVASILKSQRTVTGATLGNFENFLLLRSLRTLSLRVKRQSKTAVALASFLVSHPNVTKVCHPSLASHPDHKLCTTQMKKPPPIISFEVKTKEAAEELITKFKLIGVATSLGGVHSSIDWRFKFDNTTLPTLLRFSVGLESKKDLIFDLKQALDQMNKEKDEKDNLNV